ncbi:MAG TPA: imidazoleglycerol-phosphate dehydratase HisB [Leptolinea sp.]
MTTDPTTNQKSRSVFVERTTNETSVSIQLNLDGTGECAIQTGLGFFDHMLEQLGHHGLFDLKIEASGDLFIDGHHTVEDVGLALGEAFSKALDTRQGITRMGDAYVPMDESLAFTCVDLSGRPYCVFQSDWHGDTVGNLPTSLIEHFWASFAITAGCNLHIRVLYGKDNHHQAEAIFKSAARALQFATRIEPRRANSIPSTKGSIQSKRSSI